MKNFFLNIILLSSVFACCAQEPWVLKKHQEGISVYARKTNESPIKEFKAVMELQASVSSVVHKIIDADRLQEWNYRTTKSRLLKRVSNTEFIVYMYNDFPWPVKDRDHISKLTLSQVDSLTVKISIKSLPNEIPVLNNVIRIEDFSGFWLVEKTKKGVRVTQQMCGDPKGNVPSGIINATLAKAPMYTFKKLKVLN